jgi:hypothetical protein
MRVCDEPPGETMEKDGQGIGQTGKAWSYWKG